MPGKSEMSPAIHNITFCGMTGAIFVLLTAALILYTESFVTTSWSINKNTNTTEYEGLWQTCTYRQRPAIPEWFMAVQVLLTIGFFGIIVCFGFSVAYMTANRASKNLTLASLAFVSFATVVIILIGVSVYGCNRGELSWSYGMAVASGGLILLGGILTIVQIRRSNVHLC